MPKSGRCEFCGVEFKHLAIHKRTCVAKKLTRECSPTELQSMVDDVKKDTHSCGRCGDTYYCVFNAYCFKVWKDESMCHQCYMKDTSIQNAKASMFMRLIEYEVDNGRDVCERCSITLWKRNDNGGIDSVNMMHRDHIDVFSKVDCVALMVSKGCVWGAIRDELQKCRSLCVPCHSLVTRAEKVVGIQRLKRLRDMDPRQEVTLKKRATERVKALIDHVSSASQKNTDHAPNAKYIRGAGERDFGRVLSPINHVLKHSV